MNTDYPELLNIEGFDWDKSNTDKNIDKHQVSPNEAEEIFLNTPLIIADDNANSDRETRYFALGKTYNNRRLMFIYLM